MSMGLIHIFRRKIGVDYLTIIVPPSTQMV